MKKPSTALLYSSIGIFLGMAILVAANMLSSVFYHRFDFTGNKAYTLSNSTKEILAGLEKPVVLRFYFSAGNPAVPLNLKKYAGRVRDLLREYREAGRGKIKVEQIDPVPYSDEADAARMDGINIQYLTNGGSAALGLNVSNGTKSEIIPFLSPQKESILEYEITRMISRVSSGSAGTVGIISAFPVLGKKVSPKQMAARGRYIPRRPWVSFRELKNDFQLKELSLDCAEIPADIKVLMLVQPSGISKKTLLAVDRFLLRGGGLAVIIDPFSFFARVTAARDKKMVSAVSCGLPEFLKAWGVEFNRHIVAADMTLARRVKTPGKAMTYATFLEPDKRCFSQKSPITAGLEHISFPAAGIFRLKDTAEIKKEVLVRTTKDSMPVSSFLADSPDKVFRVFKPDKESFNLAVLLSGKFKTAFPGERDEKHKKNAQESSGTRSEVVLVADTDFLVNDICVQLSRDQFGRKFYLRKNDNINFIQNMIEYLAGDVRLSHVRSRQILRRPFTVVEKLKSKAEMEYKNRIATLEDDLKKTQERLNSLRKSNITGKRFILSPEQEKELRKFRGKVVNVKKELKELKKNLYRDIDTLEAGIKWFNIALIPFLIACLGLVTALSRRRKGGGK